MRDFLSLFLLNGEDMIYFDYAATSLKRREILEYILDNKEIFDGNPDSLHKYGRESKKILENSRITIADSLNAKKENIIFTSGASESNNTILRNFKSSEIITSAIEHDSVLNTVGKKAKILRVDNTGLIDIEDLEKSIDKNTKLVSIMMVNNEIGTIEPIEEVAKILKNKDIWLHVDAVQAYGHLDIDIEKLGINSLSLSGHKIGGINGFGILYADREFKNLITGGEQEKDRRAGTSFTIGAYSMAQSIEKSITEREHIREIKAYFIESLKNLKIKYEINGDIENSSDHILNLYFPDFKNEFLLTLMDMNGIAISAGSACRAGSIEPSHVISAIFDKKRAMGSVRFSFGYENKKEDVDKAMEVLNRLAK